MKRNISLIGMSGAGKTVTAVELGRILPDFEVVDTDERIISMENRTIAEIFAEFGENYFRKIENEVINAVFHRENQIVALGGGAFENENNREIICQNGIVIYLKAQPKKLFERLKNTNDRPLLSNNFSVEFIAKMLSKREANYEKSDIIIETEDKTPYQVAQKIAEVIKDEF